MQLLRFTPLHPIFDFRSSPHSYHRYSFLCNFNLKFLMSFITLLNYALNAKLQLAITFFIDNHWFYQVFWLIGLVKIGKLKRKIGLYRIIINFKLISWLIWLILIIWISSYTIKLWCSVKLFHSVSAVSLFKSGCTKPTRTTYSSDLLLSCNRAGLISLHLEPPGQYSLGAKVWNI